MDDILKNALARGELSGAYIVQGSSYAAADDYVDGFLPELFCGARDSGAGACGQCPGCVKAKAKNHADLLIIGGGTSSIKVDEVRAVFPFAAQRTYEGGYKAIYIREADKMTPQAQNTLLKVLEEPPEGTVFLLGVKDAKNILPTILSRCIILNTRTKGNGEGLGVPEWQSVVLLAAAKGDAYLAKEYADMGYFEVRQDALLALNRLLYAKTMAVSITEKLFIKHEAELGFMMSAALIYIEDVLYYKYAKDSKRVVNHDLMNEIEKHSELPVRLLVNTSDLIAKFYSECEICPGMNRKLALTSLLFNILEVVV